MRMRSIACGFIVVLSLTGQALASSEYVEEVVFPSPQAIQNDIQFWVRVYTEISSSQGFIHDDENLGVVYETVPLRANISRRDRHQQVGIIKKRYQSILYKLARGHRENLSSEEARVLALWPKGTSNKTFRHAAKQLRFQLGQSDRFKEGLIRSGKWVAHIRETLKAMEVPEALAALPHVESSFNPSAYSFVGAAGLWQFTRSTGKRFMRIDHVVDERLDPYAATAAAAKLLKYNYDTTGTWPLAITAYNHGLSGMRRAAEKLGSKDIVPILRQYDGRTFGFASRNFYVAFLAALEVSQNKVAYFGEVEMVDAEEFFIVEVPDYILVETLAKTIGVSIQFIREHNPALRPSVYEGAKFIPKGFKIRLPASIDQQQATQAIQGIANEFRFAQQKPDLEYRVQRGDTLSQIAERFGLGLSKLIAANNINSKHRIRIGQTLRLPEDAKSPKSLAEFHADEHGYYAVKRGDTVSLIADRFKVAPDQLLAANDLSNPHTIYVGQRIKVAGLQQPKTSAAVKNTPQVDPGSVVTSEHLDLDEENILEDEPILVSVAEPEQADMAFPEMTVPVSDKIEASEPVSSEEAEMLAPVQPVGLHPALSADPSDYTVQTKGKIIVQAAETLGHYAHWLQIPTQRLRDINRLKRNSEVVIGKKIKLDFSYVDEESFEQKRVAYHRDLQESFFNEFMITGTVEHKMKRGEMIWFLSQQKYNVPIWLLRQHNPDLKFKKIRAGDKITIPVVVQKDKNGAADENSLLN